MAALIAAPGFIGLVGAVAPGVASAAPTTVTFNYNGTNGSDGSAQTFTVPSGVSNITVTAYGAQGGGYPQLSGGGLGGEATASLSVAAGEQLVIYVGGQPTGNYLGGFNGGGSWDNLFPYGGAGGGASDVRVGGNTLTDRVVIGGGGGGAGGDAGPPNGFNELCGGAGGGPSGQAPTSACDPGGAGGAGGTASAGGAAGGGANPISYPGSLGDGGSGGLPGIDGLNGGTGGGGGLWGGGGGGVVGGEYAGGGGGSGYVPGGCTASACPSGVHSGNGLVTITYSHTRPAGYSLVSSNQVSAAIGVRTTAQAACRPGTSAVGGGVVSASSNQFALNSSYPQGADWVVTVSNNGAAALSFRAFAVCIRQPATTFTTTANAFTIYSGYSIEDLYNCPVGVEVGEGVATSSTSTAVTINSLGNGPTTAQVLTWVNNASATNVSATLYAICAKTVPAGYSVQTSTAVADPAGGLVNAHVACPGFSVPLSGGLISQNLNFGLHQFVSNTFFSGTPANPTGWEATMANNDNFAASISTTVTCAGV